MVARTFQLLIAAALMCLAAATLASSGAQPFHSASRASLEAAMAKVFGNETRIDNPGNGPGADGFSGEQFGSSVALSGDTAVAAAGGGIYVFRRTNEGWVHQQKLVVDGVLLGNLYGQSLAVSTSTIVVAGRNLVYAFERSSESWSEGQRLTPSDAAPGSVFGHSVSVAGDLAVVGAPYDAVQGGAAFVFRRENGVWIQHQKVTAPTHDRTFGFAVAVSGETLLVGGDATYAYSLVGNTWMQPQRLLTRSGASIAGRSVAISGDTAVVGLYGSTSAHAFVKIGASWQQQQELPGVGLHSSDYFGMSVAISGDTILIGARYDDVDALGDRGSVHVFVRDATGWTLQQLLSSTTLEASMNFGASVAISGEVGIVGVPNHMVGPNIQQGVAEVLIRESNVWTLQHSLSSGAGGDGDRFGYSIAVSGDTAVVGVPYDDVEAMESHGSAYVFVRSGAGWSFQHLLLPEDGIEYAAFGSAVAVAGDTILVGAFNDDIVGAFRPGTVYAFTRSRGTWRQSQKLSANDAGDGDRFGASVAMDQDTAVIGAFRHDFGPNAEQGAAYVFVRAGGVWSQFRKLTAANGNARDRFGFAVGVSGSTFLIGAPFANVGLNDDQGSAYVFTGGAEQQLMAIEGQQGDALGTSVSISDNVAVVGAPGDQRDEDFGPGSAHVFARSGENWVHQQQLGGSDGFPDDFFGRAVAISGNMILVGADGFSEYSTHPAGAAYVFARSGKAWAEQQVLTGESVPGAGYFPDDRFGSSVALSGGAAAVGAPRAEDTGPYANPDTGAAFLYFDASVDRIFESSFEATLDP